MKRFGNFMRTAPIAHNDSSNWINGSGVCIAGFVALAFRRQSFTATPVQDLPADAGATDRRAKLG